MAAPPGASRALDGGAPNRPGAYCPLPEPGQKPACLAPAEARYAGFFASVDGGRLDPSAALALEADLRSDEAGYLALSSVAYAYFRLAQEKASAQDPTVMEQLERWNSVLSSLYEDSDMDADFRRAVREAAVDLQERVPSSGVLAAIEAVDERLSMRGPLQRLLERAFGDAGDGGDR